MQGHVLAPPHAHPQLKSFQAVQPTDSLPIYEPTLTPQQDPNPQVAKPRAGMGQIANA